MLGLVLDALVLMALTGVFLEDHGSFFSNVFLALVASICFGLLAGFLIPVLGLTGAMLVSLVLIGGLVGVSLSFMHGAPFKTCCKIAGIYIGYKVVFVLIYVALASSAA